MESAAASLKKVESLIKTNMDLLEKYKDGLRAELRSCAPKYKKIQWYKEHIASLEDTIARYCEYREVCELRYNKMLNRIKTIGR